MTVHLEQSAACTTSTRAVIEHLHACTEDTPVFDRPAPLRLLYAFPNTNALTHILCLWWPAAEPCGSTRQSYRSVELFIDDDITLHWTINK